MNVSDWLRRFQEEPRTRNLDYAGLFYVVFCGFCGEEMKSPFSPAEYWERWELLVRVWQRCENCGKRNRVSKGARYVEEITEEDREG